MSAWLLDVIEAALPDLTGERRDELAAAILEALPARVIAETIEHSTMTVLKQRAIADGAGDLAREIGRNAAATVVLMLQVNDDIEPLEPEVLPEASSPR